MLLRGSAGNIVLVAIMNWSGEHRAFVIEAYFKNNDSVITIKQRLFRNSAAMFSGVFTLRLRPVDFRFKADDVKQKFFTHNNIVFLLGTDAF